MVPNLEARVLVKAPAKMGFLGQKEGSLCFLVNSMIGGGG